MTTLPLTGLSTMRDESTATWMCFDDEDWDSADERTPERRKRVSTLSMLSASQVSPSNDAETSADGSSGNNDIGTIKRQSMASSEHTAQNKSSCKSTSPARRSSRSISPKVERGSNERRRSKVAEQSGNKKHPKDKQSQARAHHSRKASQDRRQSGRRSSSRREQAAKSLEGDKPMSFSPPLARCGSDKVEGSPRELMAKVEKCRSQRRLLPGPDEARDRSRSSSQRRRNVSMRVPAKGASKTLERQSSIRVARSERRRVRKNLSLQEGYNKLSDETIQKMGSDKVNISDLGPQLPSAAGGQLNCASERLASRPKVAAPFRRSKTDLAPKRQLSLKAGGTRLIGVVPRRSLTGGKDRRASNSFQQVYDSTVQAFTPKTFANGNADTSSSTLEDKVTRMKELSRSFHRSHSKRLVMAETHLAREVPLLFQAATSA